MGPSDGLRETYGHRRCSGGRTRTLNNWTRTSRVADYTTPEWVGVQISRAARTRSSAARHGQGALFRGRGGGKMLRPGFVRGPREWVGFGGPRHAALVGRGDRPGWRAG